MSYAGDQELLYTMQERGMSEKESQIYLTVLELWSAPASVVARRTSIKRVTAYSILKDLERQGVAQAIEKKGMQYFIVVDPTKLLEKLEDKAKRFEQKIPELMALTDKYSNKPRVQYFEGMSGIREMYDDLLSSETEICAFLWFDDVPEQLHEYLIDDFLPRRIWAKISVRAILSPSERNCAYVWLDETSLKESIMIEHELYDFASEINLYGPDKIMFSLFTESEMWGVILHSPKMYQGMKSIFEVVWSTSPQPSLPERGDV